MKARKLMRGKTCCYFTIRTKIESTIGLHTATGFLVRTPIIFINTMAKERAESQTGGCAPSRTPFCLTGHERVKEKKKNFSCWSPLPQVWNFHLCPQVWNFPVTWEGKPIGQVTLLWTVCLHHLTKLFLSTYGLILVESGTQDQEYFWPNDKI